MKITEKTPINHLIKEYPETIEVLMAYGLRCVGCHFSDMDTLEDGALMHGISDEEMRLMIKDINKAAGAKDSKNKDILSMENKGK